MKKALVFLLVLVSITILLMSVVLADDNMITVVEEDWITIRVSKTAVLVNEDFDVEIITSEDAKVSLCIGNDFDSWSISSSWKKDHKGMADFLSLFIGATKLQAGSTLDFSCYALANFKDGTNKKSSTFTMTITATNRVTSPVINQTEEEGNIIIDVNYNKSEPVHSVYISCDHKTILVNWSDGGHWANGEYVSGTDYALPQTHFVLSELEPGNHKIDVSLDSYAKGWLNSSITHEFIFLYMPGDITGDGEVNIMDVIRLLKYVSGWGVEVNQAACDVTGDGAINIMDVIRLLKYVSGWNVTIQ